MQKLDDFEVDDEVNGNDSEIDDNFEVDYEASHNDFEIDDNFEVDDVKMIMILKLFLLGGTLAFNELQIEKSEQKLLEELLYSPPLESSVPYMLGLAEFLTKSTPIISSSIELLFGRFS